LAVKAPAVFDPTVRAARADDADDIAQLVLLETEARSALIGQRGGDRWLVEHPAVGSGWPQRCNGAEVLVAHIGEVIVGYLVADLGEDLVIRIDQIWVTPAARELGFGDEMLAAGIAAGRAAGAIAVQGEALPGDRHTKNLYERAGIVARLIVTYKAL
jgi:ribosomal protein S18 acetylase RimI-like enzyme